MIDIALLIVLGVITWVVASEGVWGAALTFVTVIFAGLLAMNFFEPLAAFLEGQVPSWRNRFDFIALLGLFALFVSILRELAARVAPVSIEVYPMVYQVGRWGFALASGYVTAAILLTAFHTVNIPYRAFLGFKPERKNFFEISAPDRQWLAFTQHVTEKIFPRSQIIRHVGHGWDDRCFRVFDGMRIPRVGKREADYFPTYIIRYASRRTNSSGKKNSLAPATPPPASGSGTSAPTGTSPAGLAF